MSWCFRSRWSQTSRRRYRRWAGTTSAPLGIATYKTLKAIPKPYRSLAPVIEGVRRELANGLKERTKKKGRL